LAGIIGDLGVSEEEEAEAVINEGSASFGESVVDVDSSSSSSP
jgi:hypothetical protein